VLYPSALDHDKALYKSTFTLPYLGEAYGGMHTMNNTGERIAIMSVVQQETVDRCVANPTINRISTIENPKREEYYLHRDEAPIFCSRNQLCFIFCWTD